MMLLIMILIVTLSRLYSYLLTTSNSYANYCGFKLLCALIIDEVVMMSVWKP